MHHSKLVAGLGLLFVSCSKTTTPPPEVATPAAPPAEGTFAREVFDAMDPTTDPCSDFYQFACGGWIAKTELPADKPAFGRGFSTVDEHNREVLKGLVEGAVADPSTPEKKKIADFWTACNDTAAIDARGMDPVRPSWAKVDAMKDKKEFMKLLGSFASGGQELLFDVWVDSDQKNPGLSILHLLQGGTGLPERGYYLDESHQAERDAYLAYIAKLLQLAGEDEAAAKKKASVILNFETELAKLQWDPAKMGDATATYNKLDRKGLVSAAPGLDWAGYLAEAGGAELTQINVMTPPFFEGLPALIAATDLDALKTWTKFRLLASSADELGKDFDEASFDFYGRTLYGQQEQEDRWKRCLDAADGAIGDLLAKAYVDAAFAGDSKDIALDMIQRVEHGFEDGLAGLSWMDDDTRARAVEKVRAITNKIGYPAEFRTYDFEIAADDHYGNLRRAGAATHAWWWAKSEKPVDPNTWFMTAPTVNAYYNPTQNEIVFPAGILQPPFFSAAYPKAANFGAMGLVMGHEITHGFDDQGRKFDGSGLMTDWWAADAVTRFEEAASCVEKQYDAYEVQPGVHLDGDLTLGENIADLGGSRTAYRAYQKWVAENGAEPEVAGLSGDKLFWVAFAQSWCQVSSPEYQKVLAATDPHSPPKFRVNGPLSNLPEFSTAFQCAEGTPMHPVETCEVW